MTCVMTSVAGATSDDVVRFLTFPEVPVLLTGEPSLPVRNL